MCLVVKHPLLTAKSWFAARPDPIRIVSHSVDFVWDKLLTSTLDPSRDALPGGAGDSSSPFVTVERFDFLPGMVAV